MALRAKKNEVDQNDLIVRTYLPHLDFLNQQKHMFSEARDYFVRETNETERALCAQLMLVDTVLITGSLIAMSSNDLLPNLSNAIKSLLFIALVCLLLSIGAGITYYFKMRKYNLHWAKAKHKAMKHFLDINITSWKLLRKKTNDEQTNIAETMDSFWLRMQIIFMGAAAACYLVAFFGLLFNIAEIIS